MCVRPTQAIPASAAHPFLAVFFFASPSCSGTSASINVHTSIPACLASGPLHPYIAVAIKYFKRSRRLLLAHRSKFSDDGRLVVDRILRFSDMLLQAYALKEMFYRFMASPSSEQAAKVLQEWLEAERRLVIPEFSA